MISFNQCVKNAAEHMGGSPVEPVDYETVTISWNNEIKDMVYFLYETLTYGMQNSSLKSLRLDVYVNDHMISSTVVDSFWKK